MECLNTINKLKINKEKMIGRKVVIIVEGESEEFKLLKKIFVDVLNYKMITMRRRQDICKFESQCNKDSTVIVVNTSNSNINSIFKDYDYKDKLYNLIKEDFNDSLKNVPIYILWDRDVGSNKEEDVIKVLDEYRNSTDNGENMNGILLLSYPCIESYELSNFDKQLYKKEFSSSQEAKDLLKSKRYNISFINKNTLLKAVVNMHRTFNKMEIKEYDPSDFYDTNMKIFNSESSTYLNGKKITALSLISIMLIDLGIIEEND